jgi:5-formyltetrahydrofolate cyclo-ligase
VPTYRVGPRRIVRSDGQRGSTSYTMVSSDISSSPDPLDAQKHELRRRARLIRNAISPEQRAVDAQRVAERCMPIFPDPPRIVSAYYPTAKEFDSRPLLQRLTAEGCTLALPAVMGDAPLIFRRWSPGEPLTRGQRGIMEPISGEILRPALLLIPLLAFDARGYRLGYGGGHYDRTLPSLRRDDPVIAVGLAFDEQEMAQLPVGPHDQLLDWILTPSGARRFE